MEILKRLLKIIFYAAVIPLYIVYYPIDFIVNTVRWVITGKYSLSPLIVYILTDEIKEYIKEF